MKKSAYIILLLYASVLSAQISVFPYKETFDSIVVPALPSGWSTTNNKNITGDFITSATSVRSAPNAVSSTDATKSQSLISPLFDFSGRAVDSLEYYERRTSSHLARVLVEASINADTMFGIRISSDSLRLVSSTSYIRRAFPLPDTLSGKSNVRFRIRIVADTNGSSGIYRIDDVRLTTKKAKDLSISLFSVSPPVTRRGDDLTALIGITNRAAFGMFAGEVRLYDSLTLISSHGFSHFFTLNDSLIIPMKYASLRAGRHPLTAVLLFNEDEDTTNNRISFAVNTGYRLRTMLINEFMYTPSAGMPEWIEIVNNCGDTIPLAGWKVSDAGTVRSALLPLNRNISPYSYFIITTDTNAFKSHYTVSAPIVQSLFPALNNSGDAVVLFDHNGNMIDSVTFLSSWGGETGKSLERIDTAVAATLRSNWCTTKHPDNATPGRINSVTQKSFDASIMRMIVSPEFPVAGNALCVSSTIKNIGQQILSPVKVQLYIDADKDSILSPDELFYQQILPVINPNDSVIVPMDIPFLAQGVHWFGTKISTVQDDDTINNIMFFAQAVGIRSQSIVITEIMYAPPGDMPEWVEGYNTTSSLVNIGGWKISDNGTTKAFIQNGQPTVAANSYFVVTTDTVQFKTYFPFAFPLFQASFSSLNNTSPDAVILTDERGAAMDSVHYRPSWGGANGNSLQRFDIYSSSADSANWRSGLPSAGTENDVARKEFDIMIRRISSENTAKGISVNAIIVNTGRQTANSLVVNFFHDINRDSTAQISELLSSSIVTSVLPMDSIMVTYEWNASIRGKQFVIVSVEYSRDERIQNNTAMGSAAQCFPPQSLVINEIMYEPQPGDAEFVELLNRSNDTIDIAEWKLMDQPNSSGNRSIISLSATTLLLPPGGYVLVASDSSFFTHVPSWMNGFVVIQSSLSLSNSGEDIVLVDLMNTQIDSVRFSPSWHLKNLTAAGRSLERINPNIQSTDVRNWSSSVARSGTSPARSNSIFTASSAFSSSLFLSPNPFSPDRDGFEDFLSINYSLPANSSTIRIRIFDVTGRLIRRLAQNEPSPSAGSLTWNGLDDDGNLVRIGMYIILFEALDNFGGVARTMKDVAVVGRKL
jgi:hypothetical protein